MTARLRSELQKRELSPYLERDDFWWMGFVPWPGKTLNNWTPWCNQNALLCFMLLENDRETLAKAVEKSMRSVDLWLESLPAYGACDEGTTYWYKSVGYLLDYLENLERITGGALSFLDKPWLKALGEFIVNADIEDCWQVNFADGKPSRRPFSWCIYRYGHSTGNKLMMDFAADSYHRYGSNPENVDWTLFYQGLEAITAVREMKALSAPEFSPNSFVRYPDTDVCFRDKAVWSFFGLMGGEYVMDGKGGYSEEYTSKDALIKAHESEFVKEVLGSRKDGTVNSTRKAEQEEIQRPGSTGTGPQRIGSIYLSTKERKVKSK